MKNIEIKPLEKEKLKQKFDTIVTHKNFGDGKILEIKCSLITVKFENCEKRFQYPKVFDEVFLTL